MSIPRYAMRDYISRLSAKEESALLIFGVLPQWVKDEEEERKRTLAEYNERVGKYRAELDKRRNEYNKVSRKRNKTLLKRRENSDIEWNSYDLISEASR